MDASPGNLLFYIVKIARRVPDPFPRERVESGIEI